MFPRWKLAEPKTKLYRKMLDTLDAKKTALLVESGQKLSENLFLGSRNLDGVELVLGSSEVHPYDLLRYEHAIFSVRMRLWPCRRVLKKNVSRRQQGREAGYEKGGCVMATLYTTIRRPLITEKGMGAKEI